jgi:hypothetical protein
MRLHAVFRELNALLKTNTDDKARNKARSFTMKSRI